MNHLLEIIIGRIPVEVVWNWYIFIINDKYFCDMPELISKVTYVEKLRLGAVFWLFSHNQYIEWPWVFFLHKNSIEPHPTLKILISRRKKSSHFIEVKPYSSVHDAIYQTYEDRNFSMHTLITRNTPKAIIWNKPVDQKKSETKNKFFSSFLINFK